MCVVDPKITPWFEDVYHHFRRVCWGGGADGEYLKLWMICPFKHTFSQTDITGRGTHQSWHLKMRRPVIGCTPDILWTHGPRRRFYPVWWKHQDLIVLESERKPLRCNKVTNKESVSSSLGYELCALVGSRISAPEKRRLMFSWIQTGNEGQLSTWCVLVHMTGNRSDCVIRLLSHIPVT